MPSLLGSVVSSRWHLGCKKKNKNLNHRGTEAQRHREDLGEDNEEDKRIRDRKERRKREEEGGARGQSRWLKTHPVHRIRRLLSGVGSVNVGCEAGVILLILSASSLSSTASRGVVER